MAEWCLERYDRSRCDLWNGFVARSRNATFLFDRAYMDYHSDRFADCSWLAYKGNSLRALLPANLTDDGVLHSHQGLTYGGWLLPDRHMDGADMLDIFETAAAVWKGMGIRELDYKPIPGIYASRPSEEDLYALFRLGAVQTECGISQTISLRRPLLLGETRRQTLGSFGGVFPEILETDDAGLFMTFEEKCLLARHGVRPVHSAEEMAILKSHFPERIRFFVIVDSSGPHAGVCIYDTGRVAHCQYIAADAVGMSRNLLTPLHWHLATDVFRNRDYYDFGTSTEQGGMHLNVGLLRHKASYGATAVVYNRYRLKL